MEVKRYLMILWKWWWVALIAMISVVMATLVFTYTMTPEYVVEVKLLITPSSLMMSDIRELRSSITALDKPIVTNTYAEVGQSSTVIHSAWEALGLEPIKGYKIRSAVLQETNVVVITVTGPNPVLAQQLAESVSSQTLEYVSHLYEVYELAMLDAAEVPSKPESPDEELNIVLGVVIGVGLGVVCAFLAEYLQVPFDEINPASIIDVRTGAYKDTYLLQRIREEISRAKRSKQPFVVSMAQLENFEEMLKGFPPNTRQTIMKQIVQLMKQSLPEDNLVAQWRSDVLALLMPDSDRDSAQASLQRLKSRLEWTPFEIEETGFKLNLIVNFGLAVYELNGTGPEALLDEAEKTLGEPEDVLPIPRNPQEILASELVKRN